VVRKYVSNCSSANKTKLIETYLEKNVDVFRLFGCGKFYQTIGEVML